MNKFDEFIEILKDYEEDEIIFYIKNDAGTRFDGSIVMVDIENFIYFYSNDLANPSVKCCDLEKHSESGLKYFTDEEIEVFCYSAKNNKVEIEYPTAINLEEGMLNNTISYIDENTIEKILDTYQEMSELQVGEDYLNKHTMDLAVVQYGEDFHCALDILWKKKYNRGYYSLILELFVIEDSSGRILETKEINLKDVMKNGELEKLMKELLINTIKSIK